MSGPRLCSLRIPNGGGNVLIDNIESDSTPVIYTRRSRFLDEELDETKDIITTTTSPYSSVNGGTTAEQRTYHKISMLMTDGVMTTLPNDLNSDSHKFNNKLRDTIASDLNAIDIVQSYDEQCNQRDDCDPNPNQKYCTNTAHMPTDSLGFERTFNGLTINDHDLSQNNSAYGQQINDSSTGIDDATIDLKVIDSIDANDKQTNQFLHIHQFRQTHQISLADETSLLRRQQLSRVAEWVQNNNHEACLGSSDTNYKSATKLNNNSDEISNRSIDRNLKSLSMINCNNLTDSELEVGKYLFSFTILVQKICMTDTLLIL